MKFFLFNFETWYVPKLLVSFPEKNVFLAFSVVRVLLYHRRTTFSSSPVFSLILSVLQIMNIFTSLVNVTLDNKHKTLK